MGLDDIFELLVLLLFFVVGPLLRRYRQGRQVTEAGEAAPAGPPGWSVQSQPQSAPDHTTLLVRSLREQARVARALEAATRENPLLERPGLALVAQQLAERTREAAAEVVGIVERGVGDGESAPSGLGLSRALEELRAPLRRAKAAHDVLAELTSQRTDARALRLLQLLDRTVSELDAGTSSNHPRQRRVFFYDGPPLVITEIVGEGPAGLVPFARPRIARALGWTSLASGMAYDALSARPGCVEELRTAAMFGPLVGKSGSPPFFATATIDMARAVGAWMPQLAGDVLATVLLGRAYALGVVDTALSEGVGRLSSATIETHSGRYLGEAPLVFRLSLIDATLSLEGNTELENGLARLASHFELPVEGRFVRPNGLTQRILVAPLVDYARALAQVLYTARLSEAGGLRLSELIVSRSGVPERSRIQAAQRGLLAGEAPGFNAVTLLCAAALAEATDAEGRPFAEALVRSLLAPARPALPTRHERAGRVSDRALLRDALVLSEIL